MAEKFIPVLSKGTVFVGNTRWHPPASRRVAARKNRNAASNCPGRQFRQRVEKERSISSAIVGTERVRRRSECPKRQRDREKSSARRTSLRTPLVHSAALSSQWR